MSRRPASCGPQVLAALAAALIVSGCRGSEREAPAPPPIAASKPAPTAEPTPSAAPAPAPPIAPARATPSPEPAAASATAHGRSPVEPPYTPGTSLPGSIPPAPLPEAQAKTAEKPADPLTWLQDSQARKADYARRVTEAEGAVETTRLKVTEWEKVVLAFKNPFLPRPVLAPEDQQAIEGMNGGERVRWAEGRAEEARTAHDAAQKALADLRANPPLN